MDKSNYFSDTKTDEFSLSHVELNFNKIENRNQMRFEL